MATAGVQGYARVDPRYAWTCQTCGCGWCVPKGETPPYGSEHVVRDTETGRDYSCGRYEFDGPCECNGEDE